MSSANINELLNAIVAQENDIDAIFVVDMFNSSLMYLNRNLQNSDPRLYSQLMENFGFSEALAFFSKLASIPTVLDNFGVTTNHGNLEWFVCKLNQIYLVIYFSHIEDLPILICYLSTSSDSVDLLITSSKKSLNQIVKQVNSRSST